MISELGQNLNFIIKVDYNNIDNWKSFALWYSISKLAPDAVVSIKCINYNSFTEGLFAWTKKLGIKIYYKDINIKGIDLITNYIMVREFTNEDLNYLNSNEDLNIEDIAFDVKTDNFCSFVNYSKGCGSFIEDNWINRIEPPFSYADSFMMHTTTANEVKVLQLWKQMSSLYSFVQGS